MCKVIIDRLKALLATEKQTHPQTRIFVSLRERRDAELDDARQRVERLMQEMEARDMRTHS